MRTQYSKYLYATDAVKNLFNFSNRTAISVCLALIFITVSPASLSDNLVRNGSSVYSDLGKDQFAAALYLETYQKNPQAIESLAGEKRMEVRVLNNYSKRRWFNFWMQSISINNSRDTFSDSAKQLVDLMQAAQSAPQAGDLVEYISSPKKGTSLRFNGTVLISGLSNQVFDLLLRTWIGAIPPNANFKEEILGKQRNSQANELLERVSTAPDRIALAASWIKPPAPVAKTKIAEAKSAPVAETAAVAAAKSTAEKEVGSKPSETASKDNAASDKAPRDSGVAEQLAANGNTKANNSDSSQETSSPDKAHTEEPHTGEPHTEQALNKPDNSSEKAEARIEESDDDNVDFSVAAALAMRDYTPLIVQKIFRQTSYPGRAVQRGWEGTVRMSVLINKSGALEKIAITQSSQYTILDKAAVKAVEQAAPFPEIPDELNTRVFDLSVPITFQLK
jgi:protein TonB